jgi:hypothetical protein
MTRREFITLLGGAAAAWPLAARAQQAGRLLKIGFLGSGSASSWSRWSTAFMQRLNELGWVEGRTVTIEMRWAEGHSERFAEMMGGRFSKNLSCDDCASAARRLRASCPGR